MINELKIGQKVTLVKEHNNPYDANAVAVYFHEKKLGYVPASHNALLATLLYFGHKDLFEARIQTVDLQAHPEKQFRVVVKVIDKR